MQKTSVLYQRKKYMKNTGKIYYNNLQLVIKILTYYHNKFCSLRDYLGAVDILEIVFSYYTLQYNSI